MVNVQPDRISDSIDQNREILRSRILVIVTLIVVSAMLFLRLGHYPLWDDECDTALEAEGICRTGDMSVLIEKNIVAFDGGFMIKNFRDRFTPPFPFYLTAASFLLFGVSAFSARLPFALCGLATFVLILHWFAQQRIRFLDRVLICMALAMNVSLILYFRQCRYYGTTMFCTVLAGYFYLRRPSTFSWQFATAITLLVILASNYITAAAVVACLAADWLLFSRREVRPSAKAIAVLLITMIVIGGALLAVWNPFGAKPAFWLRASSSFGERATHLWWNFRDLSVNEFCIFPLLLAAPISLLWRPDRWLVRAMIAASVFFCVTSYVSPHRDGPLAEVRYFCPIILICAFIEARVLLNITGRRPWLAIAVAVPVFGTNLLSGSTIINAGIVEVPARSTIYEYARELYQPLIDPNTVASQWMRDHVQDGDSILCLPDYNCYPLMFLDPKKIYAWQLSDPPEPQFRNLPAINFVGRVFPKYVFIFGLEGVLDFYRLHLRDNPRVRYKVAASFPLYGVELYRPELFLRTFATPRPFDPQYEALYILKKGD